MKRVDDTPETKLTLYSEIAQFTSAVDALYERLAPIVGDTDLQKRALNTLLAQLVAYPEVQRIGLGSGNFTGNPLGIGYRPFKAVFDALTRYGFITIVRRGSYSRRKDLVATGSGVAVKDVSEGLQTRFEPTPDLIGFIRAHSLHAGMIRNEPGEVIILKDQNGK